MRTVESQMAVRVPAEQRAAFQEACAALDTTPSREIRKLIRDVIAKHQKQLARLAVADKASQGPVGAGMSGCLPDLMAQCLEHGMSPVIYDKR